MVVKNSLHGLFPILILSSLGNYTPKQLCVLTLSKLLDLAGNVSSAFKTESLLHTSKILEEEVPKKAHTKKFNVISISYFIYTIASTSFLHFCVWYE